MSNALAAPAAIVAAIGATGSGKSTWIRSTFLRPKPTRLAVWDFKRIDYPGLPALDLADLDDVEQVKPRMRSLLRDLDAPTFALRVFPPTDPECARAAFDWFCRACYAAGDLLMIVEELAFVTSAQRAPHGWRLAIFTGREYQGRSGNRKHLRIVFTSQRPASIDKDCFGNCTVIQCGRLTHVRDRLVMGQVLGVKPDEIGALPDLGFIRRNFLTDTLERGTVRLRKRA